LELEDESSWIWLTSEPMGFPVRSEFTKENHNEAGISKQCNNQRTDHFAAEVATFCEFSRNFSTQKYEFVAEQG